LKSEPISKSFITFAKKYKQMKQRKLLNKPLLYYLGFGVLMALLTVPVFYLLMMKYHVREVDDFLLIQREKMYEKSLLTLQISEIPDWNNFNNEATILPDMGQTGEIIFTTEDIFNERKKRNEPHRVLYSQIEIEGERYILTIRANIYDAQIILLASAFLQLLLFFGLMAGVIIINHLIQGKLWKPFYQALSLTEYLDIQHDEIPAFKSTDTQEFTHLNHALETLIENYRKAYKIQKEFTEKASNEIQTPLAMFHSTLDMLLQLPGMTEEQREFIQTIHEDSSQLIHTGNNLQLLAQLDNQQFTERQPLNIADIVADSLSSFSEQTDAANISVETYLIDRSLTVNVNKKLAESLVNNLITNAIKHNTPNGRILVTLHGNRLDITNTGVEQALDNAMLFRRFGRMNRAAKGSGLGLAIVQQICSLYGWEIFYGFKGGMHRFALTFNDMIDFYKPERLLT